jgi:hypothetical protein
VSIMIGTHVGLGAPDSGEQLTFLTESAPRPECGPRTGGECQGRLMFMLTCTLVHAEIKPEWVTPLKQCVYAFTVLYNPAIMATKTAILILYYRFFSAYLFLRYASLFLMAIVNIAGVVLTFLYIPMSSRGSRFLHHRGHLHRYHCGVPLLDAHQHSD